MTRIQGEDQALIFSVVALGTLLSLGLCNGDSSEILFVYPCVAVFLAFHWSQADLRAGQIGTCIRLNIEPRTELNWETDVHQKYRQRLARRPFRARPTELVAVGIFVVAELVSLALAISRAPHRFDMAVLGAIAVMGTILVPRRRPAYCRDIVESGGEKLSGESAGERPNDA